MSNFLSSLAKHGKYGRRPKVEIPEKTASAWYMISRELLKPEGIANLCFAITWHGVVPQRFMRPRNWSLALMISVGDGRRHQCQSRDEARQHGDWKGYGRICEKLTKVCSKG